MWFNEIAAEVVNFTDRSKLQKLQVQANLTQEQLAERLFVSRELISKWELGQRKPDIRTLREIANLFSIDNKNLIMNLNGNRCPASDEGRLGSVLLCVYYISIHDFHRSVADAVHYLYPSHLFLFFELFGHAFSRGHFFYQPGKQIFCPSVNLGKVGVQCSGHEQIEIQRFLYCLM